jgi:hypothetical protein
MDLRQPARKLRSSKAIANVLNRVSRATHLGNYWHWLETPDLKNGIDIASIVCPLRYDVLIRRDFFAFYESRRELYRSDFEAFVKLAKQGTYYTWYTESELVRCKPQMRNNLEVLERGFVTRIKKSVALYESVNQHGYTPQIPIVLKTAERLLPPTAERLAPPTGKIVRGRYFLADGCHRLALLMAKGYTVLPADHFRVKYFREFSPFDSTSVLAHSLPITPSAYFTFLSSKYCAPFVFEDKDSFLGYIHEHKPELLPEVLSLIQVDRFDHNHVVSNGHRAGKDY